MAQASYQQNQPPMAPTISQVDSYGEEEFDGATGQLHSTAQLNSHEWDHQSRPQLVTYENPAGASQTIDFSLIPQNGND